ncbi:neuromedin-B [Dipodomys spectabilis]|uniref:neuromedin-B n=1 Tax=Dipodomys spectabilis TaxID=105255 RepID=UPI001C53767B|nr:neuromedin-B [Dipodomys spectabilis]
MARRLLGRLLLLSLLAARVAPLGWDLPEPRGRASKIRVHPRGNLWATGHFMGKKSLEPAGPAASAGGPGLPRLELYRLLLRRAPGASLAAPRAQEAGGARAAEVKRGRRADGSASAAPGPRGRRVEPRPGGLSREPPPAGTAARRQLRPR